MAFQVHVDNVKYSVGPQEVREVLQTLQVADGLLDIRLDRAEGWKEAFELMIRRWGPKFLLKMVVTYNSLQSAKQCANALHGHWIKGLSKEDDETCLAANFGPVSTIPLTPFESAALAAGQAPPWQLHNVQRCTSLSNNSLGLSSVPVRPSLQWNLRVPVMGANAEKLVSEAPASSSRLRPRSRSPCRPVPTSAHTARAAPGRFQTMDLASDDELRAGLRYFLVADQGQDRNVAL
eukprot:s3931_g9.t1